MNFLKKVWFFSFKERTKGSELAVAIILYIVAHMVAIPIAFVIGCILGLIPVLGFIIASALGTCMGLYFPVGILLAILSYCKVIK